MSGIFGIFKRNGDSVEEKTVNTMLDAVSYWEPDERKIWINGSVALGHAMLWNTPESRYEHFPVRREAYVLTMDARIDNREELLKEIELPERPLSEIGDSEFILGAYKKWGEACPKYLLGDFAFAIWDEKKQQLFCARDHVGVRQLYYCLTDDFFVFGNDIKGLLAYPEISKEINDEAVANFFVNDQLNSRVLTFFKDILKLPPAHRLTISKSGTKLIKYWDILEDMPQTELQSIDEYTKKLRELLEKAVYARMRSSYPITSHLSGGLDSSAIAVLAARKLKQKNEKLLAFNWLHKPGVNDDPSHFEWYNSATIAAKENIEHHYVTLTPEDIYHYMLQRDIVYGETTGFWYEYSVRKSVQNAGSRTILSGWGGDDFATYKGRSYYSDLVSRGKILFAFRELMYFAKKKNIKSVKSILGLVYGKVFMPFVPRKLYCYFPKNSCRKIDNSLSIIKKDFKVLVKNIPYLSNQPGRTIKKDMLTYWSWGGIQTRLESWNTEAIGNRIEYTYPLLDKRIIQFMLTVPSDYLVHNREGRYLFRMAVRDLLPNEILWMGKEKETKRVSRYLSLLVSVYKTILDNKDLHITSSEYINVQTLIRMIKEINEEDLLLNYMEIDASVYISLSRLLNIFKRD